MHQCAVTIGVVFSSGTRKNKNLNPALQQRFKAISLYDQYYRLYNYLQVYNIKLFVVVDCAEVIELYMLGFYAKTCGLASRY